MNTVQNKWTTFDNVVIPKDAPDVQRKEMKRAFYAGVVAIMNLQENLCEENDDTAIKILQGWQDECKCFAQQVTDGEA